MTKEEWKELTAEDPEDMFGSDWENVIADWIKPHICLQCNQPGHSFCNKD